MENLMAEADDKQLAAAYFSNIEGFNSMGLIQ